MIGFVFLISICVIIYSWRKSKKLKSELGDCYSEDENYKKTIKMRNIASIICISCYIITIALHDDKKSDSNNNLKNEVTIVETVPSPKETNDRLGITEDEFVSNYNNEIDRASQILKINCSDLKINGIKRAENNELHRAEGRFAFNGANINASYSKENANAKNMKSVVFWDLQKLDKQKLTAISFAMPKAASSKKNVGDVADKIEQLYNSNGGTLRDNGVIFNMLIDNQGRITLMVCDEIHYDQHK